jgi:hypothetical protein
MRSARAGRSYDVPEGDPDTALRSIWVAANRPGAERLVKAAQRYGLGVSMEVARAFINRQSIAQIFAPERKSEGAVAARSMDRPHTTPYRRKRRLPIHSGRHKHLR